MYSKKTRDIVLRCLDIKYWLQTQHAPPAFHWRLPVPILFPPAAAAPLSVAHTGSGVAAQSAQALNHVLGYDLGFRVFD